MKICNKDMQRPYVRQHVFLAGWGSFEASNFFFINGIMGLNVKPTDNETFCLKKSVRIFRCWLKKLSIYDLSTDNFTPRFGL